MGITAIRTPIGAAEERHHPGCISDRPYHAETVQTAYRAARKLIIDVVGSLFFFDVGCTRGVDRHELWRRPSDVAVIQTESADSTATGRRSAGRFAMEAVGNFVLVFAFGVAISTHSWFSPLLIGAPLVAMIFSSSRVLGGHYNPAVTVAMLIRRRLAVRTALAFWLIQVGAGLLAAASVRACDCRSQAAGDHGGDDIEGFHPLGRVRTRTGPHLCAVLYGTGGFDGRHPDKR